VRRSNAAREAREGGGARHALDMCMSGGDREALSSSSAGEPAVARLSAVVMSDPQTTVVVESTSFSDIIRFSVAASVAEWGEAPITRSCQ
jgi:hypothetical protein